jgi:sulfite reductase (NADPH) hemoprotein beta-component
VALAGQILPQGHWTGGKSGDTANTGATRRVYKQRQPGLYTYPVTLPQGELSVAALRGIAELAENLELDEIRATQDQNLLLLNVPEASLSAIDAGLAELNLGAPRRGDSIVACPGASTCRLGITASMKLAPKLSGGENDLRIRISGCHNSCAQPETSDIGIYGEGRRLFGKLIPHYQLYFGGEGSDGGGLALKGPSVPSARIEAAIGRVQKTFSIERNEQESFHHWARRQESGYFKNLLSDLTGVSEHEAASLRRDHGESADFRVLSLGGGECGAPAKASVAPLYFEAANERRYRNAYFMQREYREALACAGEIAKLVIKAVHFPAIGEVENLLAEAQDSSPEQSALREKYAELAAGFACLQSHADDKALPELFAELDTWTAAAGKYNLERDRQLDLTGMLPQAVACTQAVALRPPGRPHAEVETRQAAVSR